MFGMRRKCAKSLTGVADVEEPSTPAVPAVSWEELVARASAALDERGEKAHQNRVDSAARISERNAKRGVSVEIDVDGVRRALTAYYADCLSGGRQGVMGVFAKAGVKYVDYRDGRALNPEFTLVMEYLKGVRDEVLRQSAEDLKSQAQDAQRRLVTQEGCELNQRAVELSLKATMRDVYGDGEDSKGAAGRKPIIYNLPNLTLNMIMSPAELAAKKLDGKQLASEVINV